VPLRADWTCQSGAYTAPPVISARSIPIVLRRILLLLAASAVFGPLAACSGETTSDAAAQGPVVLAAASLQESLTEAAEAFAVQGHAQPVLSFAGTSALARQVEGGAPADIFLGADEQWMDELERNNQLAPRSRVDLLTNELVVVAPTDWTSAGRDPFAGGGRIAIADPQAVPAGRYARAALESLGRWDELRPRLVPAENVRAALALVESGQVDRAIVYATDAQASRKVAIVYRFTSGSHPPIRYAAALLAESKHEDARAFLDFLRSIEGRAIFRRHGFGIAQ